MHRFLGPVAIAVVLAFPGNGWTIGNPGDTQLPQPARRIITIAVMIENKPEMKLLRRRERCYDKLIEMVSERATGATVRPDSPVVKRHKQERDALRKLIKQLHQKLLQEVVKELREAPKP